MMSSSVIKGNRIPRQSNNHTLLKVVILGDGGVGKSCLLNRFVNNHFDDHSFHTIGVEFLNKQIEICGETFTLQIWDTAGQERFKSLRTPFYRGSDICMLTYSVSDRTSFRNLSMWRNEFLYYANIKDNESYPFLVVANKVDVNETERMVTETEANCWCEENGRIPYVETSAKDAVNVEQAFVTAVACWSRLEASLEREMRRAGDGDTVNLQSHLHKRRKTPCCSSN